MSAEIDLLPATDTMAYHPPGELPDSSFIALTDSAGVYVFLQVPSGRYSLVVRMVGYRAIRERLRLDAGRGRAARFPPVAHRRDVPAVAAT